MLKKMRIRVILAAMLAFLAVILLIAVLVNLVNSAAVAGRADQTLTYVLNYEDHPPADQGPGKPPEGPFMALPDLEANYMTRFFIVRFDPDGKVVSISTDYIASIDEDEAVRYAETALQRRSDRGYMGDYRFRKSEKDGLTVVAFLNVSREIRDMRSLRLLTLMVSGASLLLVFVLVALLSRRAIRPIEKNIERQKQFITDASHELKTPLTSISTSLDVITMEHGEDEWTDNIRSQTVRMSKLVAELVALSRLDEEIPLPNREHFSLSTAAWETVMVYETQAKACGKTLNTEIEDDVSMVGDKSAMQQMISVLLDNAIRYSDPDGEIRFGVSGKRNKAVIEVFNTCDYETPPDTERIFDRFYRPDSSRSTETGGNGVGLAIAKAVAQAHGGSITARCPSGKTMTIKVVI
ncbi:Signal transduction histidine kinase [Lachnospiraceae bacterium XBB2008]|nr:Signal transduction histidine kinase [Lachnospiraceae bacterium XBB2008]